MKINVRNYRAITSAEFEFDRIALIGAPNEGGKSSLTQAISTVVLGESVVLDGIKVSEAGSLVRSGSPKAELHIEGDTGEASLTLPTGKLHTKGERPPRASRFALGLTSVVHLDPKERTRILLDYLKAAPDKEDLAKDLNLPPEALDKLWDNISKLGWDGAHDRAKTIGVKLKGQWESVTSERFGSVKSHSWVPQGWSSDLASASVESLAQELSDAQSMLEAAIASNAVSAEERQRIEALANNVDVAQGAVDTGKSVLRTAESNLAAARKERNDLPQPEATPDDRERARLEAESGKAPALAEQIAKQADRIADIKIDIEAFRNELNDLPKPEVAADPETGSATGNCPHLTCGKPIFFAAGRFFIPSETQSKKATKQAEDRRQAIQGCTQKLTNKQTELNEAQSYLGRLESQMETAEKARAALAKMPSAKDAAARKKLADERRAAIKEADENIAKLQAGVDELNRGMGRLQANLDAALVAREQLANLPEAGSDDEVNACREKVRIASERAEVFRGKTESDRLARDIAINQEIVAKLSPGGIRQKKLAEAISSFNARLKTLSRQAGWISRGEPADVQIDSDLQPSYGEWQYRFLSESARYRTRATIQIAMAQMDKSDLTIFDAADILDAQGRAGLLKMVAATEIPALILMTEKRDRVPDLVRAGIGRSFWIESGTVQAIGEEAAEQAA